MALKTTITRAINEDAFEQFRRHITTIYNALDKKFNGHFLTTDEYYRFQKELEKAKKDNHAEALLQLSNICREMNFSCEVKSSYQYAIILYILQINTKRPEDVDDEEPEEAKLNLWGKEYNSKQTRNFL